MRSMKSADARQPVRDILIKGGTLIFVAVVATILWRYNPVGNSHYPKCPLLSLTGIYCPGCGSLRALHYLLHGDCGEAIRYNVLAMLAIPFLIAYFAIPRLQTHPKTPVIVLYIVIAYFILRNIPFQPFLLLAPHAQPAPLFAPKRN